MLGGILQIADVESVVSDVVVLLSRWVLLGQRHTFYVLDVGAEQGHSHFHTNLVHLVSDMEVGADIVVTSFDAKKLSKDTGSVCVGDPNDVSSPQAVWTYQGRSFASGVMFLDELFIQKFEDVFAVSLLGKWLVDS